MGSPLSQPVPGYTVLIAIIPLMFLGENFTITVGENIIATTKIRNNYGAIQSFIFSNIAIAISDFSLLGTPCKVITFNLKI